MWLLSALLTAEPPPSPAQNVAIVAHVDHGKTTLVDAMLQESLAVETEIDKDDRMMDSNDQEKERGITILAKNAAINYKGVKVHCTLCESESRFCASLCL